MSAKQVDVQTRHGTVERAGQGSPWDPFRHRTYAVIWAATVVSNTGGWMYSAAAAWLMTTLDPHPVMVSLVQVATSLPLFLFALPAGAMIRPPARRYVLHRAQRVPRQRFVRKRIVTARFSFQADGHLTDKRLG